jgi:hypothetical protein
MARLKKTQKYYNDNPEAKKKKKEYDTKYHSTSERKAYRGALVKARRDAGVYGKGGKDMSHAKDGTIVPEDKSKNRARNGANKKSTKK